MIKTLFHDKKGMEKWLIIAMIVLFLIFLVVVIAFNAALGEKAGGLLDGFKKVVGWG